MAHTDRNEKTLEHQAIRNKIREERMNPGRNKVNYFDLADESYDDMSSFWELETNDTPDWGDPRDYDWTSDDDDLFADNDEVSFECVDADHIFYMVSYHFQDDIQYTYGQVNNVLTFRGQSHVVDAIRQYVESELDEFLVSDKPKLMREIYTVSPLDWENVASFISEHQIQCRIFGDLFVIIDIEDRVEMAHEYIIGAHEYSPIPEAIRKYGKNVETYICRIHESTLEKMNEYDYLFQSVIKVVPLGKPENHEFSITGPAFAIAIMHDRYTIFKYGGFELHRSVIAEKSKELTKLAKIHRRGGGFDKQYRVISPDHYDDEGHLKK